MLKNISTQQLYTEGVSILTFTTGQIVAYVPSLASKEQTIISGGSIILSAAIALAGAVHHWADTKRMVVTDAHEAITSIEERLRTQISASGMTPVA